MKNSNLIFEEKKIDSKELIEMIERLPYEKKKTIYDMIKGYELLSMVEEERSII